MECPRCGDEFFTFPAISRYDNATEVCSSCGSEEALLQWFAKPENKSTVLHPTKGSMKWKEK